MSALSKDKAYRVISKERYHVFALGEIVYRRSEAYNFILDGHEYQNARGVRQYLNESEVTKEEV